MSYDPFEDDEGNEHGLFQVFHLDHNDAYEWLQTDGSVWHERCSDEWDDPSSPTEEELTTSTLSLIGWYWWACFPGCMPDGDPNGPHPTAQAAYDNAQED